MKRLLVPIACALCTIPLAYALQRLGQVAFLPADPDPRLVHPGAKIAMFWRLYAAVPIAIVAGIAADAARGRFEARLRDALPTIVAVTAIVCAVQGLLAP